MPFTLTPQTFVAKWRKVTLKESAATKEHFLDLCGLVGHPTPAAADARFRPAPVADIHALRQRLGLPPRYVLFLGANKPHKNLPRLVEAWGKLKAQESAGAGRGWRPQMRAGSGHRPRPA